MSTTATSRQLAKDVSFIPGSSEEKEHVLLLVDDEPTVLSVAADALKAAGYKCLTARSASQALITLKNPNYIFDLLICDVLMSGMNGIDLMKHISQIFPTLPVIVISGTCDIQIAVEAHRAGAADYLVKPFRHADLINAVTRTITRQATAARTHDWNTAARAFALSLMPETRKLKVMPNALSLLVFVWARSLECPGTISYRSNSAPDFMT